jgi:hypothetical protein
MSSIPINVNPKVKGGKGGLWGKIAGGFLGLGSAIAAPFTAGTSLAALPAVGGMLAAASPFIGNAVDPAKVTGGKGVESLDTDAGPPSPNSPLQTVANLDPEVQKAQLVDADKAIWELPGIPVEERRRNSEIFGQARSVLDEMMRRA